MTTDFNASRERADKWLHELASQAAADARETTASYYRTLVMVTGGATALSITFADKLLPQTPVVHLKGLLVSAWLLFGCSLISTLLAFAVARRQQQHLAQTLGRLVADTFAAQDYTGTSLAAGAKRHVPGLQSHVFDWAAMVFFAVGLVALILFVATNYAR